MCAGKIWMEGVENRPLLENCWAILLDIFDVFMHSKGTEINRACNNGDFKQGNIEQLSTMNAAPINGCEGWETSW